MKRRSFLAMLGFAPVAGVAAVQAVAAEPYRAELLLNATGADSQLAVDLEALAADTNAFLNWTGGYPYLFDASGVCLNP